jgi:hypothetical protein
MHSRFYVRSTLLMAAPVAALVLAAAPAHAQDGGFTALLNRARAARGLAPVAYDAGLASWAASNNAAQCASGLGHFVQCGTGQVAASAWDAASALAMWTGSPGHYAILFSPTATTCGFSVGGGFATANVGCGVAAVPVVGAIAQAPAAVPAYRATYIETVWPKWGVRRMRRWR